MYNSNCNGFLKLLQKPHSGILKTYISLLVRSISMIIDDIQQQLKDLEPIISIIKDYWANAPTEKRIAELSKKAEDPIVWQDPQYAPLLKELQALKTQHEQYVHVTQSFKDMHELVALFGTDEGELEKLAQDLKVLGGAIRSFKVQLLLSGEQDRSNCYISVNCGAGGTESQDWAEILLRMFVRFCEKQNLETSLIDHQVGEEAGIKSGTLLVKGKNAYGLLKSEHGIHRLVRISPYDANKRRHTSFAGVYVIPETPKIDIVIDPKDLRIDTYRAGGAGGQHVNKTDSAVRITHAPSGIVVQCQSERSQLQNKETSMKMLKAKLAQKQEEEAAAKSASVEKKKIEWGSQIRSYVLHPYKMVKDHRTECESPQPDLVLDGDLMEFIEQYLIKNA